MVGRARYGQVVASICVYTCEMPLLLVITVWISRLVWCFAQLTGVRDSSCLMYVLCITISFLATLLCSIVMSSLPNLVDINVPETFWPSMIASPLLLFVAF